MIGRGRGGGLVDSATGLSTVGKLLVLFTVGFFVNISLQLLEFSRHTTCDETTMKSLVATNLDCAPCEPCPECPKCPKLKLAGCPEPPPCEECPPCETVTPAARRPPPTPAATPANALSDAGYNPNVHPAETFMNTDKTLSIHTRRATGNPALAAAFERFRDVQNSIIKNDGRYEAKYVHCSPANQMGNRVRFVVPCLLFAMITDRALVVEFGSGFQASMRDLFDIPFDVDADAVRGGMHGSRRTLTFSEHAIGDLNALTCSDIRTSITEKVIEFGGAYYFVPHMLYNPYIRDLMDRWFPDGKIAEPLTYFLMYPNSQVWDIVHATKEKWLKSASFTIGLQARNNRPPDHIDWVSTKEWQDVNECAKLITPPHLRENAKWYVAADAGPAIELANKHLDAKHRVTRWKPEEFVLSSGPAQLREAVADIITLAVSDELIINPWSSYGQMAATYHRKPAYWYSDFKTPEGHDYSLYKEVAPSCFKLVTTEYSVREWTEWSQKLQCFHKGMLADHWM